MYALEFNGKAFGPSGEITDTEGIPLGANNVSEYNKSLEAQEIAHIKTGPERLFLYVKDFVDPEFPYTVQWAVTTFLGTKLACGFVGPRKYIGYNRAFRRAITVRLFGTLYHGWYMESSGEYCRLKRAKRQNAS